jgi:hypothetical protein
MTEARRAAFLRRFEDDFGQDPAQWERYCRRIAASPFLTNASGNNRADWKANFDFVLEPRNVMRILEGEWDPARTARSNPPDKFAWLDTPTLPAEAPPEPDCDLEMRQDEHGTYRPH